MKPFLIDLLGSILTVVIFIIIPLGIVTSTGQRSYSWTTEDPYVNVLGMQIPKNQQQLDDIARCKMSKPELLNSVTLGMTYEEVTAIYTAPHERIQRRHRWQLYGALDYL